MVLGITNARSAASPLAVAPLGDVDRAVDAMRWEVVSPWAPVLEKLSTHPLVARRIQALEESGLPGSPRRWSIARSLASIVPHDRRAVRRAAAADGALAISPWLLLDRGSGPRCGHAVTPEHRAGPGDRRRSAPRQAGAEVPFRLRSVRGHPAARPAGRVARRWDPGRAARRAHRPSRCWERPVARSRPPGQHWLRTARSVLPGPARRHRLRHHQGGVARRKRGRGPRLVPPFADAHRRAARAVHGPRRPVDPNLVVAGMLAVCRPASWRPGSSSASRQRSEASVHVVTPLVSATSSAGWTSGVRRSWTSAATVTAAVTIVPMPNAAG